MVLQILLAEITCVLWCGFVGGGGVGASCRDQAAALAAVADSVSHHCAVRGKERTWVSRWIK